MLHVVVIIYLQNVGSIFLHLRLYPHFFAFWKASLRSGSPGALLTVAGWHSHSSGMLREIVCNNNNANYVMGVYFITPIHCTKKEKSTHCAKLPEEMAQIKTYFCSFLNNLVR